MIRDAKKRGVKITCETCPHYFSFTVDEVLNSGTNAKMNPPLREEKDRQEIIKGLKDGTIDAIITDHAPHSEDEKNRDLSKAPNGIIGFETALAAEIMNLVDTRDLSYLDFTNVEKMISMFYGMEELEYINSTATGCQHINLGCRLMENTDDIRIDIKFKIDGKGGDITGTNK